MPKKASSSRVVVLVAEFEDHLDTTQIESCVNRIEAAIRQAHPTVTALFIKPQTQATWKKRIAGLADADTPAP